MRMLLAAVVVLALAGCTAEDDPRPGPTEPAPTEPAAVSTPAPPPADWRTVERGAAQVSVPPEFEDGNAMQRITQWCVDRTGSTDVPLVSVRGATTTLVACPGGPDAERLVEHTGTVVTIQPAAFSDGTPNPMAESGGDRTVVQVDDMIVVVQAPEPLRSQIARTARRAG